MNSNPMSKECIRVTQPCEAVDCEELATELVKVSAGRFGTITLIVCANCVGKFRD